MGCGWTPNAPVDTRQFTAVEIMNGSSLSSVDFWEKLLAKGMHLTAVGGSDNHNALIPLGKPNAIGFPTTVVEARELSVPAIIEGIRKGRVFLDMTSSRDKVLDMDAATPSAQARMGEDLATTPGTHVKITVHVSACENDVVHVLVDGHELSALPPIHATSKQQEARTEWTADGKRHWIRAEVRDSNGNLLLLGNPIYVNFPPR